MNMVWLIVMHFVPLGCKDVKTAISRYSFLDTTFVYTDGTVVQC